MIESLYQAVCDHSPYPKPKDDVTALVIKAVF